VSTIRFQDVTKTFDRPLFGRGPVYNRGLMNAQADSAFAERVRAQVEIARVAQAGADGKILALDGVNLTIPDGQTISVVGPSGCGKSTLLRVAAGLVSDYKGHVFYDDQDMENVPPKDRYIGMVFQSYALYPHFKGHGNLSFFFRVRKFADEEAEKRIRVTSEIMGIGFDELLKRKPGTLSGGQQQRLAIGRAIVRNPRLFLFDEPLSNLDAKLRVQTRIEIKRLLRRFQITSIYVTHDQVEAITLGDQIAVMRAGRIEQLDTYQGLIENPNSAFVAGFVGTPPMNLLSPGTVGEGTLRLEAIDVPLPEAIAPQVHAGQELILGIRPDAAQLVLDGPYAEGIRLSGTVENVQPDFSRRIQLVYVRTGPHFYAVQGPLEPILNVGDEVGVILPRDRLYFFDAQSEQRIGSSYQEVALIQGGTEV
jgi:ABC-type sugar transport system ATPase subunit